MGRVMVGVDGSEGAQGALHFAAEAAKLRGDSLEIVYIHDMPAPRQSMAGSMGAEFSGADSYANMVGRDQEAADEVLTQARQFGEHLLRSAADAVADTGVEVETTLLFDRRPARRLIEQVRDRKDVDLFVVGSRGRGELTGRLLGSVSQACVAHARVPVTVVPIRRR